MGGGGVAGQKHLTKDGAASWGRKKIKEQTNNQRSGWVLRYVCFHHQNYPMKKPRSKV